MQGAPHLAAVRAPGQRRLAPRDAAHNRLRLTRHELDLISLAVPAPRVVAGLAGFDLPNPGLTDTYC